MLIIKDNEFHELCDKLNIRLTEEEEIRSINPI